MIRVIAARIPRSRIMTAVALWAVFSGLTFMLTDSGLDQGADHARRVVMTTAATVSGPLAGAISRDLQSCCLRFSLMLLPFAAAALILGIGAQFLRWPQGRFGNILRGILWVLGWLVWFGSGIVSFGHALS